MPDTVNSSSSTTNVALNNTPDLETKTPDTVNSITSTFNVALNINILSTNLHNLYLLTYYKNNLSNFLVQAHSIFINLNFVTICISQMHKTSL